MRLVALERSRNVPAVNSLFSIASVIFVLRLQCAYCQKYINKSVILYISQESQDDCLHADFQCFKLALWPTLSGEGKRRNEFAEWHVAWLAE